MMGSPKHFDRIILSVALVHDPKASQYTHLPFHSNPSTEDAFTIKNLSLRFAAAWLAACSLTLSLGALAQAPIKYVVYSHHHYDHIAGGKPFKDLGATFIAHKNAKARLAKPKYPDVVVPDVGVGDKHTINLGGVRVDLIYVGRNHSDNSRSPSTSFRSRA